MHLHVCVRAWVCVRAYVHVSALAGQVRSAVPGIHVVIDRAVAAAADRSRNRQPQGSKPNGSSGAVAQALIKAAPSSTLTAELEFQHGVLIH